MPYVLPGNGIQSSLNGAILAGATSFTIQTADIAAFNLPGDFPCVLFLNAETGPWEIVTVTGGQGTATLTVTRASESFRGTQAALGWASGTKVVPVLTKGSLANPTFDSLHVTGEITSADIQTQTVSMTDANADALSVAHGSVFRIHLSVDVLWVDILEPDGTVVPRPARIVIAGGPLLGGNASLILTGFDDGHIGDPNYANASRGVAYTWLESSPGNDAVQFGPNSGAFFTWMYMDNATGFAGMNTYAPTANWHVEGSGRYTSDFYMTGLDHADPHELGALWVDDSAGFVVKQSQG